MTKKILNFLTLAGLAAVISAGVFYALVNPQLSQKDHTLNVIASKVSYNDDELNKVKETIQEKVITVDGQNILTAPIIFSSNQTFGGVTQEELAALKASLGKYALLQETPTAPQEGNIDITGALSASGGSISTLSVGTISGNGSLLININASNISSGILSTNRYSAFSDLLAEGRLGAGGGLDSDTVDSRHAFEFLLLSGGAMVGNITWNGTQTFGNATITNLNELVGGASTLLHSHASVGLWLDAGTYVYPTNVPNPSDFQILDTGGLTLTGALSAGSASFSSANISGSVIAASFSGSGSSLTNVNAAQLGSQLPSYYTNADNVSSGTLSTNRYSAYTDLGAEGKLGSGGGLDADMVDGSHSTAFQPIDSTLTALSLYNTNGLLTQTAADTFTGRTITGTLNRLSISNGDGVLGNPTIDIDANYTGQATISTLGTITTGTWNAGTVTSSGNINTTGGAIQTNSIARIDNSGNLTFIGTTQLNSQTYTWPGAQTASGFLQTNGTGTLSWTTAVPATSVPFSGITGATNISAAMVAGTGSSLNYTGSGTINASSLIGSTWAIPGAIGAGTPSTGAFTTLSANNGLTVSVGGASITGGINNNVGGITNTGAISGATTITASGDINTTAGNYQINGTTIINNALSIVNVVNVTASGTIQGNDLTATDQVSGNTVSATGAVSGGSVSATGGVSGATVSASGNITTTTGNLNLASTSNLYLGGVGILPMIDNDTGNLRFRVNDNTGALSFIYEDSDGADVLTINSDGNLTTIGQITSTIATGTAPFVVSSTTLVSNLNADLLDSQHGSYYAPGSGSGNYIQNQSASAQAASFWISGTGRLDNTLTVSVGGASITGGINANSGGISNTGTIAGATTISGTGAITVQPAAGSNLNISLSGTGDLAVNTNQLYVDTDTGRVGIGTTSPAKKLAVEASSGSAIYVRSTAGETSSLDLATQSWGTGAQILARTNTTYPRVDLAFLNRDPAGAGYLERMTIRGDGNVGIGTTSPQTTLHVNKAGANQLYLSNNWADPNDKIGGINFGTGWSQIRADATALSLGTYHNSALARDLNIDYSGNVGIGTTSIIANNILQIQTPTNEGYIGITRGAYPTFSYSRIGVNSSGNGIVQLYDAAATSRIKLVGNTTDSEISYINGSNLGIGTTSPVGKLDIVGSQNFSAFSAPGALTAGTPTAGGLCTPGTHSYKVTFMSVGGGETTGGTTSNQITCVLTTGQTVPLSAIPLGPTGTIGRKIYRTNAGDVGTYYLVITINDNTTTTSSDTTADNTTTAAPASNTTAVANIQTGGTTRMTINSTGNVGIGTTNPGALLDISGGNLSLSNNQYLLLKDSGGVARGILSMTSGDVLTIGDATNGQRISIKSGNVGIGETSPTTGRLVVKGSTSDATAAALNVTNSTPTSLLYVRNDGNVGIGTTSPGSKLDVAGDINIPQSSAYRVNTNQVLMQEAGGTVKVGFFAFNNQVRFFGTGDIDVQTANTSRVNVSSSGNVNFNSGQLYIQQSTGNVGIGTTSPTRLLGLGGDAARGVGMERGTVANTAGYNLTVNAGGATSGATDKNGGALVLSSGLSTGTGTGQIQLWTSPAGTTGGISTISATPTFGGTGYTAADVLTVTTGGTGGTVTVATVDGSGVILTLNTAPVTPGSNYTTGTGKVTTGGTGTGATVNITAITSTADSALAQRMTILGNGNVGIGTTNPLARLQVVGNSGSPNYGGFWFKSNDAAPDPTGAFVGISVDNFSDNTGIIRYLDARSQAANNTLFLIKNSNAGTNTDSTLFAVANGTSEIFTINNGGNVGIGTTSPTHALEVISGGNNNIRFGTNSTAGSAGLTFSPNNTNRWTIGVPADALATPDLYFSTGAYVTAPKMVILNGGNVGIGTTSPTRLLGLGGDAARGMGMERGTVANTAGYNLTVNAGGATSGATDKNGGALVLSSGLSTGTGTGQIQLWTSPALTTGGISTISATPTFGGTGYTANDVLTVTTGGTGGTVTVATVDGSGVILTLNTAPVTPGSNYTTGTGKVTTGGTGTGATVNITAITSTADSALAQRMTILGNGNVGIGTTSPTSPLHINVLSGAVYGLRINTVTGTTGTSGALVLNAPANSNHIVFEASGVQKWLQYLGPSNEMAYFSDGQKFAISTAGNVTAVGTLTIQGTGNSSIAGNVGIGTVDPGTNRLKIVGADSGSTNFALNASGATGTGLVVRNDGNVGIGTTSPRERLDVSGNIAVEWGDTNRIGMQYLDGANYRNGLSFNASARTTQIDALSSGSDSEIVFRTGTVGSPSEKMRIQYDGNVGIGTTAPVGKLQVNRDVADIADLNNLGISQLNLSDATTGNKNLLMGFVTDNNYAFIQTLNRGTSWSTYNLALQPKGGNVGIGTTFATGAPADKLTVAGGTGTIYNTASLGTEKVANPAFTTVPDVSWTWGTGWTHDTTNFEADHTIGNILALEQNISAVSGEIYQVVFTVKNRTAGSVTPQVGGVNGAAVSSNITSTQQIRATGTGNLKFTPTTDFDGSIDDVSVKLITGGDLKLSGLLTGGGTTGLKVTASGNVGIGTTSPATKFQTNLGTNQNIGFSSSGGIARISSFNDAGSAQMPLLLEATEFRIMNGNVGIGTTSPTNILSLGNAADRKFWIEDTASGTVGRALTVAAGGTVAGGTDITGGNLILQSGLGTGTGASTISFQTGTTLGTGTTLQTMSTKMTILGNGNVGIGTTSPTEKLRIVDTYTSGNDSVYISSGTSLNGAWAGYYGMRLNYLATPSAASTAGYVGMEFESNYTGSGDLTNHATGLYGSARNSSAYNVANLKGGFFYTQITNTGNVTNSYGVDIGDISKVSSGTATNNYGLYVRDLVGGTNNYAIYTAGSTKSYFGGNVGIGTTSPTTGRLQVADTTTTAGFAGLRVDQSGAMVGTGYGGYFAKTGASTTNVGLYATASGATNNYAAIFESGNVGIGTTSPSYKLSVSDGTDQLGMLHNGTDAYFRTTDGSFIFQTAEAATSTYFDIKTNNQTSYLRLFDDDSASLTLRGENDRASLSSGNGPLFLQYYTGAYDVYAFYGSTGNSSIRVYGDDAGTQKYGTLGIDTLGALKILAQSGEELKLGGNGAVAMTMNTSGNVGIGDTTPEVRFDINVPTPTSQMTLGSATGIGFGVTAADDGGYGLYMGVSDFGNSWIQGGRTSSATAYDISLQAAGGNVGIGTTSPVGKLDIVGSQNFSAFSAPGALTAGAPTAGGLCTPGTHSYKVTFMSVGGGETTGGTTSSPVTTCVLTTGQTVPLSAIPLGPTGTIGRKIYRTNAGDVGTYYLVITINDNTTTTSSDTTADNTTTAAPASNTTAVANIQTGGTTRMTINSSGNVGIGTTNPASKLTSLGQIEMTDGSIRNVLSTGGGGGVIGTISNHNLNFYTNITNRMTINTSGYIGVSTLAGASATDLCYDTTTIAGMNTLSTCSSSIKYKENVADLGMGLDIVNRLRPVSFQWKNTGEEDFGFIAEEVAGINPILATYYNGEITGVKYKQMTAILVNAIKEQQGQIGTLNSSVGNLGLSMNTLNSTVSGLQTTVSGLSSSNSGSVETFNSDQDLSAGEVVSVMRDEYKKIQRADRDDDKAIVGVVSGSPSTGSGYKITYSGKAQAKVSVSKGAILAGDILTTSAAVPGVAVKSTSGSGGTVGVALESTSTDGTIEIMVRTGYYPSTSSGSSTDSTSSLSSTGPILTAEQSGVLAKLSLGADGRLIVKGDLEVQGHVLGSSDTAGSVIIKAGQTQTEYVFAKPYQNIPSVTLTPTLNPKTFYWVKALPDKFTVEIAAPQAQDIEFNYHVIGK